MCCFLMKVKAALHVRCSSNTYENEHVFGANTPKVEAVRLSYETWVWNNPHASLFQGFMNRTSHTNLYFAPTRQYAEKIPFEVFCTPEQLVLFLFDLNPPIFM